MYNFAWGMDSRKGSERKCKVIILKVSHSRKGKSELKSLSNYHFIRKFPYSSAAMAAMPWQLCHGNYALPFSICS
jgi:hypothetical protein